MTDLLIQGLGLITETPVQYVTEHGQCTKVSPLEEGLGTFQGPVTYIAMLNQHMALVLFDQDFEICESCLTTPVQLRCTMFSQKKKYFLLLVFLSFFFLNSG